MKNFFKLFGIIALAAVIGFSMAACDTGGGGGGGGGGGETPTNYDAKTLVITNIPENVYQSYLISSDPFLVVVCNTGITIAEIEAEKGVFARAQDIHFQETPLGFYKATMPLYPFIAFNATTYSEWRGSGKYDVYFVIYNPAAYHLSDVTDAYYTPVTFSSKTTTVDYSKFTKKL